MRRVACFGICALVPILAAAQPAATTAAASWSVQPSPNASSADGLTGVAATSASSAWAVGFSQSGTAPDRTLIEHWNGRAWAIQPSPDAGTGYSDLYGVAATSAANAWAVGGTLIEHWNGRRWIVQPSPSVGVSANSLNSVAAVSASSAWAVGSYRGISRTLVLFRN